MLCYQYPHCFNVNYNIITIHGIWLLDILKEQLEPGQSKPQELNTQVRIIYHKI